MNRTGQVQVQAPDGTWVTVCAYEELEPGCGVAALLPRGEQAAVFRTPGGEVHAVGNRDPFSHADVIADGITGSVDGAPTVASPMYKQTFDLRSGVCLDAPDTALPVYPAQVV